MFSSSALPVRAGSQLAVRSEELRFVDRHMAAAGELAGVVEQVEFRGGSTGYAVRTAAGVIRVDVRNGEQKRTRARGEAVVLALPRHAQIVDAS